MKLHEHPLSGVFMKRNDSIRPSPTTIGDTLRRAVVDARSVSKPCSPPPNQRVEPFTLRPSQRGLRGRDTMS